MRSPDVVHYSRRLRYGCAGAAITFVLILAVLLPSSHALAGNQGSMPAGGSYSSARKVLGIQIGKDGYPLVRANGNTYLFSRVPKRYRRQFKNICLYVQWSDFNPREGVYRTAKYRDIIDDLKACGYSSISVCFCHYLPLYVTKKVYGSFDSWKSKLKSWVPYCWWARGIFRYIEKTGTISQYVPSAQVKQWSKVNAYYRTAVHLALDDYKAMVKKFAETFGKDITYWEPWDELGWGLNHAPATVKYEEWADEKKPPTWANQVCAGVRFSGWPGPTKLPGKAKPVEGDAILVQKACYEAVYEVYNKHIRDKDPKKRWGRPCVFLSSLVGDASMMSKPPSTWFDGNKGGNTSSIHYYLENTKESGTNISVSVNSAGEQPLLCERPMYFRDETGISGGHDSPGTQTPSKDWYFAEGTTRDGFDERLCLFNQGEEDIEVKAVYMTADSSARATNKSYWVPAGRRIDVSVNQEIGPGKDVSIHLIGDYPFVAERTIKAVYKSWDCGQCSVGAVAPSRNWYFAEGTSRPGFDQYLCLQNTHDEPTEASITYMKGDGTTSSEKVSIAPRSRRTVFPRLLLGTGDDPSHDFSTYIEDLGGRGLVAERPLYYDYHGIKGGDCILGETKPSRTQYFAEGTTRSGFTEYLCLQNPSSEEISINVLYMVADGQGANISKTYTIEPRSRLTVDVKQDAGPDKDISVRLDSPFPFIAERPMYFHLVRNGEIQNVYSGGSVCMGRDLPSETTYFAEGCVSANTEEYVTIMNPNDKEASFSLTATTPSGVKETRSYRVRGLARTTVSVNAHVTAKETIYNYCNAIGVHMFNPPLESFKDSRVKGQRTWAQMYSALKQELAGKTNGTKEIAVTSYGTPHGQVNPGQTYYDPVPDPAEHQTKSDQAEAIREGTRSLLGLGWWKLWYFKDIDDWIPTGGENYFGLFSYQTHRPRSESPASPNDAWWAYIELQRKDFK